MVKSHAAPVRTLCAAALLSFLLDYPLGPARLDAHLRFVLTNLGYEHETGRLQALEMAQQARPHTRALVHLPPLRPPPLQRDALRSARCNAALLPYLPTSDPPIIFLKPPSNPHRSSPSSPAR
jgi:hypothetical protein